MTGPTAHVPVVIGLDIGTTSISAVAVTSQGRIVRCVSRAHTAGISELPEGYAEQSPQQLLAVAHTCLRDILNTGDDFVVKAIGVTGQMHSTLLIGPDLQPCSNVITWQDRRAVSGPGSMLLEELQAAIPGEIRRRPGCRLAAGFMGTTIFALRRLQQWPTEATGVSFVADWIVSQLTGAKPVCDASHAASSGLFDLQSHRWQPEILQAVGIAPEILPACVATGSAAGTVTPEIAEALAIAPQTPVITALGDNQASVLAALSDASEEILINIGTGGQIVWRSDGQLQHSAVEIRCLPVDNSDDGSITDGLMAVGAGICGGDALAWWHETSANWLRYFGCEVSSDDIWQHLPQPDGSEGATSGLVCTPFFRGTRQAPALRGSFSGVDINNFTPGNVLQSIYVGIATAMYEIWRQCHPDRRAGLQTVRMSGNGSRRHPGLRQAVCNEFACPAVVTPFSEEAAVGAAILAGVARRFWPSLSHARRQVHANN
jgi:sugar (pentulose or hexulose) kinase